MKNRWDKEGYFLIPLRGTQPLCYTLAATVSQCPDICNTALLIHIVPDNFLSVFYSNCSSCQGFLLFSLIIYSSLSLSLLFPLSPSMVIWTWTKQWLRWHMWLPRSLLRPILFSLSSYLLLLYKNWYFLCL